MVMFRASTSVTNYFCPLKAALCVLRVAAFFIDEIISNWSHTFLMVMEAYYAIYSISMGA
ncbi:hypothetical protein VCRA2113O415_800002 [Vibrio crassostreae]|nr:hypothetical protein VCRA2110O182_120002 [Vibrio crassostreae]CAK2275707.1 hypothetical protein VCRA211O406_100117 [Vibrio crassostreae]CAK2551826.1 hypothetical protein VCRA2113O415_800002 [Vibrio crassostreae]CAK2974471.1 hypothetical protein VCRA2113O420_740002 [Vibrio crassostreae]CAK3042847.1 hypothetical protein VCRA2123O443_110117 [Vibrio crassostreae]